MSGKLTSFGQLKEAINDLPRVKSSLFTTLSDDKASNSSKRLASEELEKKINLILSIVEDKSFLFGLESKEVYNDYCRNLAAFLIVWPDAELSRRCMLALEILLENMAPSFKPGMRAVKKQIKNKGVINRLGFKWDDLKLPFSADKLASAYSETIISEIVEPQVIIEEKLVVKEVEKIKIVEKVNVVEKIVEGEKEDTDYFGDEDQFTELKSSFMEKPDRAGYDNQKIEICRKICGFLNAEGGTVYIGVDPTTKKAYPKTDGKNRYGVERDIFDWLQSTTIYGARINDMETYCRYVKKEIYRIFDNSNPASISLFINQCVKVGPSKNDNVAAITVEPSRYCVVYLNGKAYHRCGEECKEMNEDEILVRSQSLRSIGLTPRNDNETNQRIVNKSNCILVCYTIYLK